MYSLDFRRLALRILDRERSFRRAAVICNISTSTSHRWANLVIGQHKPRRRQKRLTHVMAQAVKSYLDAVKVTTIDRWPWLPDGVDAEIHHAMETVSASVIQNCFRHLKCMVTDMHGDR